ncbi:MAG TPA: hypothetical protein VGZ26_05175, partial [Pirellulales bacterium]|nr:hypothetical protein [Pirellulales bacterium]
MAILLTVVLVPPAAGVYSYLSGTPLHLLASAKATKTTVAHSYSPPSVSLVAGQAHTVDVPDEVETALGIRHGNRDSIAVAKVPETMQPLVLPGSTRLDPDRTARIKARWPSARVVELGQVHDTHPKTGQSEFRELRPGDSVEEGELLGVFYSVDVASKKND